MDVGGVGRIQRIPTPPVSIRRQPGRARGGRPAPRAPGLTRVMTPGSPHHLCPSLSSRRPATLRTPPAYHQLLTLPPSCRATTAARPSRLVARLTYSDCITSVNISYCVRPAADIVCHATALRAGRWQRRRSRSPQQPLADSCANDGASLIGLMLYQNSIFSLTTTIHYKKERRPTALKGVKKEDHLEGHQGK